MFTPAQSTLMCAAALTFGTQYFSHWFNVPVIVYADLSVCVLFPKVYQEDSLEGICIISYR